MKKLYICSLFVFAFLVSAEAATRWFISNSTGQALSGAFSLAALREEYALSITEVESGIVPAEYRVYYSEGWAVELRSLYESGGLIRNQWVFIDGTGTTRFVAAKSPDGAGFTEIYNENGLITEESRFDSPVEKETEDGEKVVTRAEPFVIRYTYNESFLLSARSSEWVDTYRYTHDNLIRAIDRRYIPAGSGNARRVNMPRNPMSAMLDDERFVRPASSYTSSFLFDILNAEPASASFQLDNRGRILSETRHSSEGKVTGVLTNTWDGDRVSEITWEGSVDGIAPSEKRVVKFTYNEDGGRVKEENFRNGALERDVVTVITEDDDTLETETLYMDGQPVLTAHWENGRKISEETPDSGIRRRRTP